MDVFPVLKIEWHNRGANSILPNIDDGLSISTFTVTKVKKIHITSYSFVYDSHFEQFGTKKCVVH